MRAGVTLGQILDLPPLIAIEILGSEDRLSELQEKVDDCLAFGTEDIWILDPIRRRVWTADAKGLHVFESGVLSVLGSPIRVELSEAFAKLGRA